MWRQGPHSMLVINFRNLLRDIWKNNPENFEREKSPNIQFPETKSHFPTMLISQSAFYAPQKKLHLQWFCSRERWTQTTWMESTAWFHFSRNLHRFDHLVQYKFIYIHIKLDDLVQIAENIWFTLLLGVERKQIFEPIFEIVFLRKVCNSITAAFLECSTSTDCREEEKEICLKLLFGDSIPLQSSGKSWEMRSEHVDLWTCGPDPVLTIGKLVSYNIVK